MKYRLSLILGIIRLLESKQPIFHKPDELFINLQSYKILLFPLHMLLNIFFSLQAANFTVAWLALLFVSVKKSTTIHRQVNTLFTTVLLILPMLSKEYGATSFSLSFVIMFSILVSLQPFYLKSELVNEIIKNQFNLAYSGFKLRTVKNRNYLSNSEILFINETSLFAVQMAKQVLTKNKLKEFVDQILAIHFSQKEIDDIIQTDEFVTSGKYCSYNDFRVALLSTSVSDLNDDTKKLAWWIIHWLERENDYNDNEYSQNLTNKQNKDTKVENSSFQDLKKQRDL